jgi:hypothetical protein
VCTSVHKESVLVHQESVAKPTLEISRRTVATSQSAEADLIVRSKGLAMGEPQASMRPHPNRASLVEHQQIPRARKVPEEGSAAQDQEKLVEHIIALLRRLVSAFSRSSES